MWFYCPGSGLDSDSDQDQDPHSSNFVDPDPHTINADPHYCITLSSSRNQGHWTGHSKIEKTWNETDVPLFVCFLGHFSSTESDRALSCGQLLLCYETFQQELN